MALSPVAADSLISVTTALIPGPSTSATLGVPTIITTDGLGGSRFAQYSTAAAVDAAVTAGDIAAATGDAVKTALAQDQVPASVAVVRYDPVGPPAETPSDGLEDAISLGLDVGAFLLLDRTDATQDTLATWLAADTQRRSRYVMIIQSNSGDFLTPSKPAALTNAEQFGVRMVYHQTDTEYLDCAYLGRLGGARLDRGPTAAKVRIAGVTIANVTAAEQANVAANDCGLLLPLDYGATAAQRILLGEESYDGSDWKSAVSLVYASRQCRAALSDLWLEYTTKGDPIPADARGISIAEAACEGVIAPMASADHFSPTLEYPQGYGISGSVSGSTITVDITLSLAGEVQTISVPLIGEEI